MASTTRGAACVMALFLFGVCSSPAQACPSGFKPDCTGSGSTDICVGAEILGSVVVACNVAVYADDVAASVWATKESGSIYQYTVWGTDGGGAEFCCELHDSMFSDEVEVFNILGTSHDDTIRLTSLTTGDRFENPGKLDVVVYVLGLEGDDPIKGSTVSDPGLVQRLYGGEGDDALTGYGAADFYGEAGSDSFVCGADDDYVQGDNGLNSTWNDVASLGNGDDVAELAGGADTVCGGWGADELTGGPGLDELYGGPGADVADGGDGVPDACDAETEVSCEDTLKSAPGACP